MATLIIKSATVWENFQTWATKIPTGAAITNMDSTSSSNVSAPEAVPESSGGN
jgi:hypothetical protein